MNIRIVLASASFLVLGALTAAPSFASVDRAAGNQVLADDSTDSKLDDGSRDKESGDVSLMTPARPAPMLLADDSGDGAGDSGSSSDGHGDGKGSNDGKGSSDGHGKGSSEGHGKGSSDGHGDSGHSSGHSSSRG